MTRSMVKYEYVANDKARNITFNKRKPSLIKKMEELKCLCDVDACFIMYDGPGAEPEVWPNPAEAERVIRKFQEATNGASASSSLNQIEFLQKAIAKVEKELKKEREKNERKKMLRLLFDKEELSKQTPEELKTLNATIDRELKEIDRLIEEKRSKEVSLDLTL